MGPLAYEMKLDEIYDPNDAKKNGHVVLLSEGACRFHDPALPVADVDTMRASSRSHIPR